MKSFCKVVIGVVVVVGLMWKYCNVEYDGNKDAKIEMFLSCGNGKNYVEEGGVKLFGFGKGDYSEKGVVNDEGAGKLVKVQGTNDLIFVVDNPEEEGEVVSILFAVIVALR